MIVPMKKYAFLVHHAGYREFLEDLRETGVLHVRQREAAASRESEALKSMGKEVADLVRQLKKRKPAADVGDFPPIPGLDGVELLRSIQELMARMEQNSQSLQRLDKEIALQFPWGHFQPDLLQQLQEEAGVQTRLFTCAERKFNPAWKEQYALEVIQVHPPDCYFVIFCREGEEVTIGAEELPLPATSLAAMEDRRAALEAEAADMQRDMDRHVVHSLPLLGQLLLKTEEQLELAEVLSQSMPQAAERLMVLEGFVPQDREQKLVEYCERSEVFYLAEEASEGDRPPILLKNNRFARLFEPIGRLFDLPAYAEIDLTPFFAPFFMMFFGFCLGDAGYGLVLVLAAVLYKSRAKEDMKPLLSLVQWLGLATVLFGALGGTVFGVSLLGEEYAWLGKVQQLMINSEQMFNLALALGLIQILFGLVLQSANRYKQRGLAHAISPWGWILLLLSLLDIGVLKLAGPLATWLAWAGVGIILWFNDPDAGILARLGKGVWELYGITGYFGDLLSYIRLFALGISGAILGFVINDIALRVLHGVPVLGPVLFVLMLVLGHAGNLMLAMLGAFVHPLRLTFVEFYKNAGFSGGGKGYKPFEKKYRA